MKTFHLRMIKRLTSLEEQSLDEFFIAEFMTKEGLRCRSRVSPMWMLLSSLAVPGTGFRDAVAAERASVRNTHKPRPCHRCKGEGVLHG